MLRECRSTAARVAVPGTRALQPEATCALFATRVPPLSREERMDETVSAATASLVDGRLEQALLDIAGTGERRIELRETERAVLTGKLRKANLAQACKEGLQEAGGNVKHRLTSNGRECAEACAHFRQAESLGLPLESWRREREPWGLTVEAYRLQAVYRPQGPDPAEVWHGDGWLMMRGANPEWETEPRPPVTIKPMRLLDNQQWQSRQVSPVGYCFTPRRALIVFEGDAGNGSHAKRRVFVRADIYEIIRAAAGEVGSWVAMAAANGNGDRAENLRANDSEGKATAYAACYRYNAGLPGLTGL